MTEPAGGATPEPRSRYARPVPGMAAEPQAAPAPVVTFPPPADRQVATGPRRRAFVSVARIAGPPAALAVVATIALAAILVTLQGSTSLAGRGLAVNGWLLVIGGLFIWGLLRALAAALPPAASTAFDSVRDRPIEPPSKLHGVIDIESVILDAEWSRSGVEFRLRPLLRKIAAARLLERHQVDLESEPAAAHRILGDELWAFVGPGAHGQGEPDASGMNGADARAEPAEPAEPALSELEAAEAALTAGHRPDSDTPAPPAEWTRRRRGRHGIPRATIRRAVDLLEAM
ncbi:MAG: hypothetical protein ABSC46_11250 [Candidatus Limnocylindrales bacterium]